MSPTEHEAREYLRCVLGDDWEESLMLEGAIAGLAAADRQDFDACERAVALAHERQADIGWNADPRRPRTGSVAAALE